MKIAYCISAYADPQELSRLIFALHGDAHFFIHIDKNVDVNIFKTALPVNSRIHFIDPICIRWATISQVEYQMNMMQAALDYPVDFDYIFMLSAFDYPIWSNKSILKYLEENRGKEHLQAMAVESTYYLCDLQREIRPDINIKYIGNFANRAIRTAIRKICKHLKIRKPKRFTCNGQEYIVYKGSDYFCVTSILAEYVIKMYREHSEFRRYFKHTFAPSETVIHTIAFNSTYRDNCIQCEGEYSGLWNMTPLHYIDGCHIKVLGLEDYEKVKASGKMFARKFRSGISEQLIEKLESAKSKED